MNHAAMPCDLIPGQLPDLCVELPHILLELDIPPFNPLAENFDQSLPGPLLSLRYLIRMNLVPCRKLCQCLLALLCSQGHSGLQLSRNSSSWCRRLRSPLRLSNST